MKKQLAVKDEKLTDSIHRLGELSHENTRLRKEKDAANKRAYKIAQTASKRKADLNKIESELSSLFGLTGADIDTIIAAVKRISEYEDALNEVRQERDELRRQVDLTLEGDNLEVASLQHNLRKIEALRDDYCQSLSDTQQERDELRRQLDKEIEKNMRQARVGKTGRTQHEEITRLRRKLHTVEIERNKLRMKLQGAENNARSIEKDRDMWRKVAAEYHALVGPIADFVESVEKG